MFIVLESQKTDDNVSALVTTYKTRDDAESAYHTILATAAKSTVPVHSTFLLTDNGEFIKSESFEHTV